MARPDSRNCVALVTDEERHEVAENLRSLTIGSSIQYKEQFFYELSSVVLEPWDYHDFNAVLEKLADLIDPEVTEGVGCDVREL